MLCEPAANVRGMNDNLTRRTVSYVDVLRSIPVGLEVRPGFLVAGYTSKHLTEQGRTRSFSSWRWKFIPNYSEIQGRSPISFKVMRSIVSYGREGESYGGAWPRCIVQKCFLFYRIVLGCFVHAYGRRHAQFEMNRSQLIGVLAICFWDKMYFHLALYNFSVNYVAKIRYRGI